ncbi:MAG: uroporphyrinogen decarboxylase family protein [Defluviitaleaceae bacterium]|nr:uroporphyrinogen decarboxylase family protein [Defluviitaleaceae bacterium]
MTSRERVTEVIKGNKPDRLPLYAWLGNEEFAPKVIAEFGSVAAAEDRYEFDITGAGPGIVAFRFDLLHDFRMTKPDKKITPKEALDVPLSDPDDAEAYEKMAKHIKRVAETNGRFTYSGTWGFFEGYNVVFGMEDHLMHMIEYPDEMHELHRRLAEWNIRFAENCLDAGVDMVHFSDDWGAQRGLLFSPKLWYEMIYPYYEKICAAVKKRGGYISLHSDGNISQVLDGLAALGFDVIHPFQESAGMDFEVYFKKYKNKFTVMGGLDVQQTIGFGDYNRLKSEIERVLTRFEDGGLIFMSSHAVQPHCTIEEFKFAFDFIYEFLRRKK